MISALISIVLSTVVEGESYVFDDNDYFNVLNTRHGSIEGTAIIVAVLVVATVTSFNDYTKEKQFRKLNEISEDTNIKAIRNGIQTLVSTHKIQVGDVVILETGDKICADGLIISSDGWLP